jgi:hypothetical protein
MHPRVWRRNIAVRNERNRRGLRSTRKLPSFLFVWSDLAVRRGRSIDCSISAPKLPGEGFFGHQNPVPSDASQGYAGNKEDPHGHQNTPAEEVGAHTLS